MKLYNYKIERNEKTMNRTTLALLFKFVMTFAAAWVSFGLMDGNTFGWLFIVALSGTALNYLLGDLLVLPAFGNIVASIGDGVMGAVLAYFISVLSRDFRISSMSLVTFGGIILIAEYFFHIYLKRSDKVAP